MNKTHNSFNLKILRRTRHTPNNNYIYRVVSIILAILTLLFIIIAIIIFCWQREINFFNKDYIADTNILGTFGDFTGGTLSAIFSVISCILLVKTLTAQQEDSQKNSELMELQRFNNLFFELLHLYQSQVTELTSPINLNSEGGVKQHIKGNNKNFFTAEKIKLQNEFKNKKSPFEDQIEIRRLYTQFYIENCSIAHYYRSLYRICSLIDQSNISRTNKKEYIKIIRAQLTESELLFLRYNAYTPYGQNFKKYLNKYNLLKHLPILDLLEFKKYWMNWSIEDRESLNIVLNSITKSIRKLLEPRPTQGTFFLLNSKKYRIRLDINRPKMESISINIRVDNGIPTCNAELKVLDYLNYTEIASFFKDYLLEVFYFSSFESYNHYHELELLDEIKHDNSNTYISITIKNKYGKALEIRYREKEPYIK